ncbi:MAG: SIS domain-containing protein [Planctomycetota bacterium]|nr:SIS domain-containing protein [Planctomycetota bacterium]
MLKPVTDAALEASRALQNGKKLLFCGNGGSAADAQHFAAEFAVRLEGERAPLPAIALTTDSSLITAAANDYSFENVFARQVKALANEGDLLVAISTSGNSENILRASSAASEAGCSVFGLTGENGGRLAKFCDYCFKAPSQRTMRVQEIHSLALHIFCSIAEGPFLDD